MKRAEELGLNLVDCCGQCYDNSAKMKGKEAGAQARLLELIKFKGSICPMCQPLTKFSSRGYCQTFYRNFAFFLEYWLNHTSCFHLPHNIARL